VGSNLHFSDLFPSPTRFAMTLMVEKYSPRKSPNWIQHDVAGQFQQMALSACANGRQATRVGIIPVDVSWTKKPAGAAFQSRAVPCYTGLRTP